MRPLLTCLVIAFALVGAASATAQEAAIDANTMLSARDLATDVDTLQALLERLHPGLLRYRTSADIARDFGELRRYFRRGRTLQETYLRISAFTASLRCGHTYPNYLNQTAAVRTALFERPDKVPFFFRWLDGHMIVTRDLSASHDLPPGTDVVAIDETPTSEVLRRLLSLARADGSNDDKRTADLDVRGAETYEAFDVYAPMVFARWTCPYRLVVRRPHAAAVSRLIEPALSFAQRVAASSNASDGDPKDRPLFDLSYASDGAALVRMPTWNTYDTRWNWRAWLDATLDDVVRRNAPALIVDLRGNEGGEDVGDAIVARLPGGGRAAAEEVRLVRFRSVPADLRPFVTTYDPSIYDLGAHAEPLVVPWPTAPRVPYFRLPSVTSAVAPPVVPARASFRGKVFVLVDAADSSATFRFASIVRDRHLGTIVGAPTGGNERGINGGAFLFASLPRSTIEVDIPLIGYYPPEERRDGGLRPDIDVRLAQSDVADGVDPVLVRVHALLAAPTVP